MAALTPGDRQLWGKMNAGEAVCHLTDSYLLALGDKQAAMASGLVQRTLLKWLALQAPFQWSKGFPTRPEVKQGVGGTRPTESDSDRERLLSELERFCSEPCDAPHPIFGKLTREEWMR